MPYTDEQINKVVEILGGKPAKTVDATIIGNQAPIQFPPVPQPLTPMGDVNNFQLNQPQQGIEDIVNQGTQPGTATLGYQSLIDRLKAGYNTITGKSAEQQKQNEAAGVNAINTELSGLDAQLNSLVNKSNALDIQTANVPNILQQQIEGRGVTAGGLAPLQAGELRKLAIQKGAIASEALTLQSAYYAKNNQLGLAKQKADEAVAAIYDPIQQQIDQQLKLLEVMKPFMEAEQAKQLKIVEAQLAERQKNLAYAREDKQSIIALIGMAQANYGNDPQMQLAVQEANKIDLTQPDAFLQATLLLAPYQKDPQDIAMKVAQIAASRASTAAAYSSIETDKVQRAKLKAEIDKINSEITPGSSTDINVNSLPSTLPPDVKNTEAVSAIIRANPKMGQGTKTSLANVLGVIASAQDMAANNPSGKFTGLSPFRAITDAKIPFTDIGIPFRQTFKRGDTITNEQYINGINLRTQVWASGAALTAQQTKQVEQMTPKTGDTDVQIQKKLNELSNFMLGQAKSIFQSEGINFTPQKIDYFANKGTTTQPQQILYQGKTYNVDAQGNMTPV